MSSLLRSQAAKHHIDDGEEGVEGSYRQADTQDATAMYIVRSDEEREAIQQLVLPSEPVNEQNEYEYLSDQRGYGRSDSPPSQTEYQQRIQNHIEHQSRATDLEGYGAESGSVVDAAECGGCKGERQAACHYAQVGKSQSVYIVLQMVYTEEKVWEKEKQKSDDGGDQ